MEEQDIFKILVEDDWKYIQYIVLEYGKNQILHEMGTECKGIDYIIEGNCGAYTLSHNGIENMVLSFKKGDMIGGNLLFGEEHQYSLTLCCTSDAKILRLRKVDVEYLLKNNYEFMMSFIRSISTNTQWISDKLTMYTQKSLRMNIMEYLSQLAKEQNRQTVYLPISKKQLAEYFSVQRPSLFREMRKMKEEGLILINNREITLLYNIEG